MTSSYSARWAATTSSSVQAERFRRAVADISSSRSGVIASSASAAPSARESRWRDDPADGGVHQLRHAADRCGDDRESEGERFGDHDRLALVVAGHRKDVGASDLGEHVFGRRFERGDIGQSEHAGEFDVGGEVGSVTDGDQPDRRTRFTGQPHGV